MIRRIAVALLGLSSIAAPAAAQADFRACLDGLRSQAVAKGVSGATYDSATRGVQPDMKILELMDNQPEFKTPIWDYLGALVDEERVQDGRSAMRQWGQALAAAEARYGVDSVPDAVGSTANFLRKAGWHPGLPWGYEVRLPQGFGAASLGRKNKR